MLVDIAMSAILGIIIFAFAGQIANFVANNTRITKLFRDADNPSMYRVLGVLVIMFALLNPLLFSLF